MLLRLLSTADVASMCVGTVGRKCFLMLLCSDVMIILHSGGSRIFKRGHKIMDACGRG